jgi:hypothetical protein
LVILGNISAMHGPMNVKNIPLRNNCNIEICTLLRYYAPYAVELPPYAA